MSYPIHPVIHQNLVLAGGLANLAIRLVRATARRAPPRGRPRQGSTLRPGPHTPLWNALILSVRPHLRRRGAQSNLARMLGVPPQRVHEYFVRRNVTPDAERILLIMVWLAQGAPPLSPPGFRRRGPAAVPR